VKSPEQSDFLNDLTEGNSYSYIEKTEKPGFTSLHHRAFGQLLLLNGFEQIYCWEKSNEYKRVRIRTYNRN